MHSSDRTVDYPLMMETADTGKVLFHAGLESGSVKLHTFSALCDTERKRKRERKKGREGGMETLR